LVVLFLIAFNLDAHEPITTKVRFNREVIRVLQRNCLGCHRPGGIAPMSLATYEEARPWAKAIKEEMLEKRMPPWHAVPGYGEFRNAWPLTQRDVDVVVSWVEGGAPKGDDKDVPSGRLYLDDWSLGKPDLVLKPEAKSQVGPDADQHQTLVIPTKLKQDRWVRAFDLRPGNASVVHCAMVRVESVHGEPGEGVVLRRSGSIARSELPPYVLGTWVPGQRPFSLDGGSAWLLRAGSRLVVRIHYRGSGEPTEDQSAVGLYFTKTPPQKQVRELVFSDPGALVPAGAQAHRLSISSVVEEESEAVGIRPAMNPLLISLQATAFRPDGTQQVLIWTRDYRFDWQPTYYFKGPVTLPKGTRVEVVAYFDNSSNNPNNPSDPPREVRLSELSQGPSCTLLIANGRRTED
jgi:hypothetical protein